MSRTHRQDPYAGRSRCPECEPRQRCERCRSDRTHKNRKRMGDDPVAFLWGESGDTWDDVEIYAEFGTHPTTFYILVPYLD